MVIIFKRVLKDFSLPMIYASALLCVIYALPQLKLKGAAELCFAFLLPLFAVYFNLKSFKRGAAAGFSVFAADLIFFALSGIHFSIVFSAVAAVVTVYGFKRLRFEYAAVCVFLLSCTVSLALGTVYPYMYLILKEFTPFLAARGALFGAFNNFYSLFVSDSLSELVYHTSYSKAVLTQSGIKSGVMNSLSSRDAAQLLAGKYFVNISLTAGAFAALYKKVGGRERTALISVCALALVFGDVRLLGLYLILYNPALYIAYLPAAFLSYLTASLLDLRIGFKENGSLIELFKYGEKWGYFIISAFVIGVLTYFLFRLVFSKFEINRGRYYPKSVRRILSALGGEDNIEKIEKGVLYVRNPNLSDVLRLDCEIEQNRVTLFPDELGVLSDYFSV